MQTMNYQAQNNLLKRMFFLLYLLFEYIFICLYVIFRELSLLERELLSSIKGIGNMIEQYIVSCTEYNNNNGKNKLEKNNLENNFKDHKKWFTKAINFLIRIVIFKEENDIFNRLRFENVLFTTKKFLRICIQSAWNVLPSKVINESKLDRTKFIKMINISEIIKKYNNSETKKKICLRCKVTPNKSVCVCLYIAFFVYHFLLFVNTFSLI